VPLVKRSHVVVALVLVVGLAVVGGIVHDRPDTVAAAEAPVVDETAPEHRLLQDALDIDRERGAHFGYVPKTRPPGLLRMMGGSGGPDGVADTYQFGAQQMHAIVLLGAGKNRACADLAGTALCVRDSAGATPGLGHVTVYLTGNVSSTPKAGDPETEQAKRFWSATPMVPVADADWFADLVVRGRAATRP
jgi:hypothetical protein